jgi:hypothetical protein
LFSDLPSVIKMESTTPTQPVSAPGVDNAAAMSYKICHTTSLTLISVNNVTTVIVNTKKKKNIIVVTKLLLLAIKKVVRMYGNIPLFLPRQKVGRTDIQDALPWPTQLPLLHLLSLHVLQPPLVRQHLQHALKTRTPTIRHHPSLASAKITLAFTTLSSKSLEDYYDSTHPL